MTQAGVKAYRRANPWKSKLKTAVTGKVKPGSKAAKRRKSYCARSLGQLKRASAKTRNDPPESVRLDEMLEALKKRYEARRATINIYTKSSWYSEHTWMK
jgi:hypothetical protein